MADSLSNGLKRPYPKDDSLQDEGVQKRARSNNGSPAPQNNGVSDIKPDTSKLIADARARAAAVAERLKGSKAGLNGVSPTLHPSSPGPTASSGRPMSKVEEMRARVAALTGKNTVSSTPTYQAPAYDDGLSRGRGGLSAALHPSLMESKEPSSQKGQQGAQSKFSGSRVNQSSKTGKGKKQLNLEAPNLEDTRQNPYFDSRFGAQTATLKTRNPKQLIFNQKGKYIQQATSIRRLNALEEMKKRIQASAKRVGLDEDPSEKNFLITDVPDVEWWDEGLLPSKSYSDLDKSPPNGPSIDTEDSIITAFVQHPVQILDPASRNPVAPKPMYLTKKEQQKVRRQRRMADLKETQAKIRLGLQEPPPDKVKLGNLMRVLGEEAVKDPTAVEARVNRQIAERAAEHAQQNVDRALTKEEKHEKLSRQQVEDAAKGIYMSVYKINSLANGRHRFKVSKNAEQQNLTGVCCISPHFALCIVEGGSHSIAAFRKLLINRIDWTENSPAPVREGNKAAQAAWLEAQDEEGNLKDLSANRCEVVFEGQVANRVFRKWVGVRVVESDKEATDVVGRGGCESFWALAKSVP